MLPRPLACAGVGGTGRRGGMEGRGSGVAGDCNSSDAGVGGCGGGGFAAT